MRRAALAAAAFLALLPVLVIAAVSGGIETTTPSPSALADIPPGYLALYQEAGLATGIPWEVLAGIGKVECDHGRGSHPACTQPGAENHAGAGGPMQFLAGTWATYGVDADGDGRADRWNPADAIFSAANYLRASGAPDDIPKALFAYNHDHDYVQQVLAWAARYRTALPAITPTAVGDPAALAHGVLTSPNIALRAQAAADVRAGRVDARVLAVLLALAERFRLADVGPFATGHAYYVHGTNRPSNHAFGRAVDIFTVDAGTVTSASDAAHAAALAINTLPPPLRPSEVGTPFADLTDLPGYFTDDDHHDHIHIGFDQ